MSDDDAKTLERLKQSVGRLHAIHQESAADAAYAVALIERLAADVARQAAEIVRLRSRPTPGPVTRKVIGQIASIIRSTQGQRILPCIVQVTVTMSDNDAIAFVAENKDA